ncbi:MAG: hypothetical protein B6241_06560 [Spirochaetaceae bacterium 4572_59]|nr:MAG: hypothetical protein B6241_06560 [Spirochaetaceae bacterium 4572_59]
MKITIFCSLERKQVLLELIPLFEDMFIESHAYFPTNEWNYSAVQEVLKGLEYSDHYLIIPDTHDLKSQWLAFVMGFGGYNHKQIFMNITKDPEFMKFKDLLNMYPISTNKEELKETLEIIIPVWDKDSRARIARKALEKSLNEHAFEGFAMAVEKGDRFMVGVYLEADFDVNKESLKNVTLLGLAARNGYLGILKILVNAGANINQVSSDRNNTALMDAASEGHTEIITYLIDNGAELEIISKSGQTALVLSVGNKQIDAAKILLKAGSNPETKDFLGFSARKYAQLHEMNELLTLMHTTEE